MKNDLIAMREKVLSEARHVPPRHSWMVDVRHLSLVYCVTLASALLISVTLLGHTPAFRGPGAPLAAVAVGGSLLGALIPGGHARRWIFVAFFAAALAVVSHLGGFVGTEGSSFWADADCALAEVGIGVVPAAATIWLSRRFAYSRTRATVGGLAAAMTGISVLDLTCPAQGASHAIAFHLAPAALVVLVAVYARAKAPTLTHVP